MCVLNTYLLENLYKWLQFGNSLKLSYGNHGRNWFRSSLSNFVRRSLCRGRGQRKYRSNLLTDMAKEAPALVTLTRRTTKNIREIILTRTEVTSLW